MLLMEAAGALTYAYILVIQLCRAVAVEAQAAVLAVLAPRVVLAAHAGHHVQEVDVAAAVGVAVALAVCGEEERAGDLGQEHPPSRWAEERSHEALEEAPAPVKCNGHCQHWGGLGRMGAHSHCRSSLAWGDRDGSHCSESRVGSGGSVPQGEDGQEAAPGCPRTQSL